jgi:hypothetical protein
MPQLVSYTESVDGNVLIMTEIVKNTSASESCSMPGGSRSLTFRLLITADTSRCCSLSLEQRSTACTYFDLPPNVQYIQAYRCCFRRRSDACIYMYIYVCQQRCTRSIHVHVRPACNAMLSTLTLSTPLMYAFQIHHAPCEWNTCMLMREEYHDKGIRWLHCTYSPKLGTISRLERIQMPCAVRY